MNESAFPKRTNIIWENVYFLGFEPRNLMELVGVQSFAEIFVEGMAAQPEQEPVLKPKAIQQAGEVFLKF